jgi:site-specific DNA recombinase
LFEGRFLTVTASLIPANTHQYIGSSINVLQVGKKYLTILPEDVYIRLRTKLAKEQADVMEVLSTLDVESSNLKTYFREGITLSTQLTTSWASSPIPVKEKLQKFVFPEGVTYNREKGLFLTSKVKSLFKPIPLLNCITEHDKNKQGSISAALSNLVGWTRFELATPSTPC